MRRWRGFCLRRVATGMTYDNQQVSEALEHYLNGSADKDEADWIDEILAESKLTLSDLRVGPLRMRPGTSRWWMI